MSQHCSYCGPGISHSGVCPRVKELEYYPDGRVKRVVFRTPADDVAPLYQHPAPTLPDLVFPLLPSVPGVSPMPTPGPGVTVYGAVGKELSS